MAKQVITFILLMSAISLGYTNCAKFTSATALTLPSAQCTEKLRADEGVTFPRSICESVSNFSCDMRVFSPNVTEGRSDTKICDSSDSCTRVEIHNFNTEAARNSENTSEFEAGGLYNYTEIQCSNHLALYNGVTMIQAQGETVEEALAAARTKCEERTSL